MSSNTIKITDVNPERLKKLLRSLVDIYSPSGKEEEILEYAEKYLKKAGLLVTRQEVDENRYNLIVFPEGREQTASADESRVATVLSKSL